MPPLPSVWFQFGTTTCSHQTVGVCPDCEKTIHAFLDFSKTLKSQVCRHGPNGQQISNCSYCDKEFHDRVRAEQEVQRTYEKVKEREARDADLVPFFCEHQQAGFCPACASSMTTRYVRVKANLASSVNYDREQAELEKVRYREWLAAEKANHEKWAGRVGPAEVPGKADEVYIDYVSSEESQALIEVGMELKAKSLSLDPFLCEHQTDGYCHSCVGTNRLVKAKIHLRTTDDFDAVASVAEKADYQKWLKSPVKDDVQSGVAPRDTTLDGDIKISPPLPMGTPLGHMHPLPGTHEHWMENWGPSPVVPMYKRWYATRMFGSPVRRLAEKIFSEKLNMPSGPASADPEEWTRRGEDNRLASMAQFAIRAARVFLEIAQKELPDELDQNPRPTPPLVARPESGC